MAEVKTYREALREALVCELDRDENVVLVGEDIGVYGGTHLITDGFYDRYGQHRVIDTPISEGGFVGAAIGMAMTGLRPVVEVMTWNFSFLAADQIIQNAAKVRCAAHSPAAGGAVTSPAATGPVLVTGLPRDADAMVVGELAAQPRRGEEERHGYGAQRQLAPPGLVQCHVIAGPPCIADREQRGGRDVEHQVGARGGECRFPSPDRPQVQDSGHRGHQRAGQADADEPERAVDQIRQAAGPGPGQDVEDQRRDERPDRQRDQQGMERMAVGTCQQRTVHPSIDTPPAGS